VKKLLFLFSFVLISLLPNLLQAQPDPACGIEVDDSVPQDVRTQVFKDLLMLSQVRGFSGSRLHQAFFAPVVSGRAYCDFLRTNINSFTAFKGGSDVHTIARNDGHRNIELSKAYLEMGTLPRLSTIIHEASHTSLAPGHVQCPTPFMDENGNHINDGALDGRYACDLNLNGSYGRQYIFLKNIEKKCGNCNNDQKDSAAAMAKEVFKRISDPADRKALKEDL
jgi:hypothetical protein